VTVAPAYKLRNRPLVGLKWLLFRSGPGATNHFEAGGFVRSNEDVAYPNLMFHFLPIAVRHDGTAPQGHGYQVHVGPMYSDARGSVKITSRNPRVHPALRFNYLSTDQDRREWVEAIRVARSILTQPAFDAFNDGELSRDALGYWLERGWIVRAPSSTPGHTILSSSAAASSSIRSTRSRRRRSPSSFPRSVWTAGRRPSSSSETPRPRPSRRCASGGRATGQGHPDTRALGEGPTA
jgi:hypothetical protein